MKSKLDKLPNADAKKKYEEKLKKIIPKEFEVIDLVVAGKKVVADMRELMEISNCENKMEIIKSMNTVSSYYFTFGRIKADLNDQLNREQEKFEIWLALAKSKFEKEKSESGKERAAICQYKEKYFEKKKNLQDLARFKDHAEIAFKALEKNIALIQSIGAMVREDKSHLSDSNLKLEDDF